MLFANQFLTPEFLIHFSIGVLIAFQVIFLNCFAFAPNLGTTNSVLQNTYSFLIDLYCFNCLWKLHFHLRGMLIIFHL